MATTQRETFSINPFSERGRGTKLAVDSKGEKVVYTNGRSVVIRDIKNPSKSFIYQGHLHPVTVARLSPSGFYCASGDVSGTVRVWDTVGEDKVLKSEIKVTSGRINDLSWDGDSQRIIAVGEGRDSFGRAFMMESGTNCGEIIGHSKSTNAVTMRSKRPFRAVTASDDTTLVFYTGTPYKFAKTIQKHNKFVQDVRFSSDDQKFISVGSDGAFYVFEGTNGDLLHENSKAHSGSIYGVSWSSDSKKFATASADRFVKIWNAETYEEISSFEVGQGVENQQVGIVWPAESQTLISLSVDGTLNFVDISDSSKITKKEVHGPTRAITAFAQSSQYLISGSFDGNIRKFDKSTGDCQPILGTSSKQVSKIYTKNISSDFGALVIGFDDKLRAIDNEFKSHTNLNVSLSAFAKDLSANDKVALVSCVNDTIDIINYTQGGEAPKKTKSLSFTPSALTINEDLVAVGDDRGKVHIYKFDNDDITDEIKTIERGRSEITTISFSPDGQFIAVGENNGKILVYNRNGEIKTTSWAFHNARITSIDWNQNSQIAMSTSLDTNVYFYSVEKPTRNNSIKNVAAGGLIGGVWTVNDKNVAVAGADGCVRTFEVGIDNLV